MIRAFTHPLLIVAVAMCIGIQGYGQIQQVPLHRWFTQEIDRTVIRDSSIVHAGNKPIIRREVNTLPVKALAKDTTKVYYPFTDYLLRRHLVTLKHENVLVTIDPLFYLAGWKDLADTTPYADTTRFFQNTRGIKVAGSIGDQFGFETGFYENQGQWPEFMRKQAEALGVAPGMGRWKRYRFFGFDYGMSYGNLTYQFKKRLTLQMGQGKHFIGHGYRSLLLSDAAFNYPYLSATLQSDNKKWQYTSRYFALQTLERLPLGEVPEALFKRKAMTMHYLSWSPNPHLEIALFEGIMWNRYGQGGTHMPSWGAYVPVLGVNTASMGLEAANNVLTGLSVRYSPTSYMMGYGQMAVDSKGSEGLGWQLGAKWFDLIPRLDVQIEYNHLGSGLYTHDQGFESYSHFNQSLGSPVQPGSDEYLMLIEYRYKRFFIRAKGNSIVSSYKTGAPWYQADYESMSQMTGSRTWQMDHSIGIKINVKYNVDFMFNWLWREDLSEPQGANKERFKSQILGISLRSCLNNLYNDF
jgi:hypothetical protein